MTKLDFVVIGAQKAGTTTLFRHLTQQSGLVLPTAKEAPFFTSKHALSQDWDAFATSHGLNQPGRRGTVTPAYSIDHRSPVLLADHCASLRLVLVVRDPVERSASHFSMEVNRGTERRSLIEAIREDALRPHVSVENRDAYYHGSAYGSMLERYGAHFRPEQLLVVGFTALVRQPVRVMSEILSHIGHTGPLSDIDPDLHANAGGDSRGRQLYRALRGSTAARRVFQMLPRHRRDAIRILLTTGAAEGRSQKPPTGPSRTLFADDLACFRRHVANHPNIGLELESWLQPPTGQRP